jgi:hypothetical protein
MIILDEVETRILELKGARRGKRVVLREFHCGLRHCSLGLGRWLLRALIRAAADQRRR